MNEARIITELDSPTESKKNLKSLLNCQEHFIAIIESADTATTVPNLKNSGVTVIDNPPAKLRASTKRARNGKIARLPKLYRDLVNNLLFKNVPYLKIALALGEHEITVTERNISNWKTRGGYKDWCEEQERQIHLSRAQDNLTDYLRKNDAGQIPEVGLQIAATQLSQMLLQPEYARQFANDPKQFSMVVDMLCKLSEQIKNLQKERDEAVKKSQYAGRLEYSKRKEADGIAALHKVYSSPKLGNTIYEEDLAHRNELPQRDATHFPDCFPKGPGPRELMDWAREFAAKKKASQSTPEAMAPESISLSSPPDTDPTNVKDLASRSASPSESPGIVADAEPASLPFSQTLPLSAPNSQIH